MSKYDAIVIGAGHNGLTTAALLGKAGLSVLMLERRELVGGLYFGEKITGTNEAGLRYVKESLEYDEEQIRRIAKVAFTGIMTVLTRQ